MNKLILLVVAGVALLLALNMYQKQIGKQVALLLAVVTIVVVGFFANRLLNVTEQALEVNENFYNYDQPSYEHFQDGTDPSGTVVSGNDTPSNEAAAVNEALNNNTNYNDNNNVDNNNVANNNTEPVPTMTSESLLPQDSVNNEINPSGVGDLNGKNLLNAGHHIGVNTQGCSMRNANRGLRSEPPNPQVQVSPWLQTTICPDLHRKSLDC